MHWPGREEMVSDRSPGANGILRENATMDQIDFHRGTKENALKIKHHPYRHAGCREKYGRGAARQTVVKTVCRYRYRYPAPEKAIPAEYSRSARLPEAACGRSGCQQFAAVLRKQALLTVLYLHPSDIQ